MRKTRSLHPDCEMMEDRLVMSMGLGHGALPGFALIDLAKPKPKPKPAAPSFTATPISTTQVSLSWTKVSGASKYLIEESVGGKWVQLASVSKNTTTFTISGLAPNTNYTFDVVYVKGGRKFKEVAKAATTLPLPTLTAPAAPNWTATAISPVQIQLAWTAVPNATGYPISMLNPPGWPSGWQVVGTVPGAPPGAQITETIYDLAPGTIYWFNVSAQNSVGTTAGVPASATTTTFA